MRQIKFIIMALVLMLNVCCTNSVSNTNSNDVAETSEQANESNAEENQSNNGTKWFYGNRVDDLTNQVIAVNATVISKNSCQFDANGNTARLALQLEYSSTYQENGSTFVMLAFVDDNKLCRFSDFQGSGFFVVFDNGEVDESWSLINMTDSRTALGMHESNKVIPFISKLKSSKNCRIQVNIEHVGMKTFDFDIEGLEWDFNN